MSKHPELNRIQFNLTFFIEPLLQSKFYPGAFTQTQSQTLNTLI